MKITRRKFIKMSSAAAAALSLPPGITPHLIRPSKASDLLDEVRVVMVQDESAHSGSQVMADIAQVMMDEAMRRYTGIDDIGEAYRSVLPGINLESVIGIKINCINSNMPAHPEVLAALTNGLQQMTIDGSNFPANNIILFDRTEAEMMAAGYEINTGSEGVRVFATNSPGVGYDDMYLIVNNVWEHPSRIITDYCDYLINVATLKSHQSAGASFSMKNYYGVIHAPQNMHGNYCNPFIPALNQQIRDTLPIQESLFILDAIFGTYYGSTWSPPNMIHDGIILGEDRVAVDAIGRDILDDAGCQTLGMTGYLDAAAQPPYNLGTANLDDIDLITVENPSTAVAGLSVTHQTPDIKLHWSTPEYTGLFKVLRSSDPTFASYEEVATVSGNGFTDVGVLNQTEKYFYRVLKTWG
jgi:uncharacterized protein (DUF362 family)